MAYTQLLKYSSEVISPVLSDILNTSVSLGAYPKKLKISKIIPIFKADDETDTSNYRPISLLSYFNRIFETIIYDRMRDFIDKHSLLYSSQYGFRQAHSTQHAILDMVETIQTNVDKKLYSCGVFIDLKKAFDTVNHTILLDKLNYYVFRGIVNQWFSSYLSNRTQTTEIGSHISSKLSINYVPQGSVLGPLLFLLDVNDIQYCSSKLQFVLFADDANVLYAHKDLKTLELTVNAELQNLYNWLTSNKLFLNIKKSNYVIFRPYQKRLNYDPQVYVFHSVANKISKIIGLIARLRLYIVPTCTLLNIYQSLITPYLTYGLISWGNACKTFLDRILVLQKRALRLIYFTETNDHAIPYFVNAKILPLQSLYYESVCSLMYDVNKNTAPDNILKLFSRISSVHTYNTRASKSEHFYTKESRLNVKRNAFSPVGVKIGNGIPQILKEGPKKTFKRSLKAMLLDIL